MLSLLWQPRQVSAPSALKLCAGPSSPDTSSADIDSAENNTMTIIATDLNHDRFPGRTIPITISGLVTQLVYVVAVVAGQPVKHDTLVLEAWVSGNLFIVTVSTTVTLFLLILQRIADRMRRMTSGTRNTVCVMRAAAPLHHPRQITHILRMANDTGLCLFFRGLVTRKRDQ